MIGGPEADEDFAALLREVARAEPVRPEDLAAAIGRGDLVGRQLGHFRVLERLGAGGMGVVYGAEDVRLGRRIALKVLGPQSIGAGGEAAGPNLAAPDIGGLQREARAAAAIAHPNVAAIYEAGEVDGIAYIAMEYVDGVTLRSRIALGPLSVDDVVRYARQIADGLSKAHERGLVHGDLKPDNVMVDRDDRVKVLDFGLARLASGSDGHRDSGKIGLRQGDAVAGTPAYMSPEQVNGGRVDARSDVFSFGVLVYEAVTGRTPFVDREQDRSSWSFTPRAPMSHVRPDVPSALAAIVERCLALDPARRYPGGAELARALAVFDGTRDRRRGRERWTILLGIAVGLAVALVAMVVWRTVRRRASVVETPQPSAPASHAPSLRRLTANISENPIVSAALSPDGETLAFIDRNGLSLEPIGAGATRVDLGALGVPGRAQLVTWLPDGARLAVSTAVAGAETQELWIVERHGATAPRRVARGTFTAIASSPDSARIAFAGDDTVGWVAADAPDEPAHVLAKHPGCFIGGLAWSPAGSRIAYTRLCFDSLAKTDLESVAVAGGAPVVALTDPHLYSNFVRVGSGVVWTQSGELVYPRAEWLPAEPGSSLWSVTIDESTGAMTSAPHSLTSWVGVGAAGLSADRRTSRIAFIRFEVQSDVYVGALSRRGRQLDEPRRLTLTDRNERPSAWSRDGRGVYFFSDATGNFDVFFQEIAGGAPPRPVAQSADWETSSQVSPDGEYLLYWRFLAVTSTEGVHPEIVRLPVAGGAPVHLLTAETLAHPAGTGRPAPWEMRMRCPRVASAPCVLSEQQGSVLVFRALDPERGLGAELHREPATMSAMLWDVSPDGTRLAIPRSYGPIVIQPLPGSGARGGARIEVRVPAGCDPLTPAWSADGRGLFVNVDCDENDSPFRLYYLGLDGEASLLWKDRALDVLEAEPSPDGQHLAIAVKQSHDDVWMLDGLPPGL
jgi:serine/threonine protein kinase/Tol biopolymer transport system component